MIAFNLARAIGVLAGKRHARARWATRLITLPARIAISGRKMTLHLPRSWVWADQWKQMFDSATGPPRAPIA